MSFLTLATDPEDSGALATRLGLAFTMFLAAVALQTVIAEAVPKVDFLTTIDWVAFLSVFFLCAIALAAAVIQKLHEHLKLSWNFLREVNFYVAICLFISYTLICSWIVQPAYANQRQKRAKILAE